MSEVTALDFMNLLRRVEKLEKMDTPEEVISKGIKGNFEAALLGLLHDLRNGLHGDNPQDVKVFCRKLLRQWDSQRGEDWFTSTRKWEAIDD